MALFKRSISEELSNELHGLVDDYTENLINYISINEKIEDREEFVEGLFDVAVMTAITAIPIGMWLGSAYIDSMTGGATIAALLPTGLGLGSGLISYLNRRDTHKLSVNSELDKPLQSKHNEIVGKAFLEQLNDLNLGDAFNDIKSVVDESVKNPPKFQETIGKELRNVLIKNKL